MNLSAGVNYYVTLLVEGDVVCLQLLLIVFYSLRRYQDYVSRTFIAVTLSAMMMCACEGLRGVLSVGSPGESYWLVMCGHMATLGMVGNFWMMAAYSQAVPQGYLQRGWWQRVAQIPMFLLIICAFTNPVHNLLFRLDAQLHLERGALYDLSVIVPLFYLLVALWFCLRSLWRREAALRARCLQMILYSMLVGAGIVIQYFYESTVLICTVTVGLVMFFVMYHGRQASTDPLTHLSNRKSLMKYLRERYRGGGERDKAGSLLFMDVNRFKRINDTYGHMTGDQALIAVAQAIKQSVARSLIFASRYAGDEFILVLPTVSEAIIDTFIRKLQARLDTECRAQNFPFSLRFSVGVAVINPGDPPEEAIAMADQRMYADKRRRG